MSKFKGFAKIHKDSFPLRPITDSYGSFNYFLAKFLAQLFRKYTLDIPSHVDNSTQAKSMVLSLDESSTTGRLVSLDIESLYTNVPVIDSIEVAVNRYLKDGEGDFIFDRSELSTMCEWF